MMMLESAIAVRFSGVSNFSSSSSFFFPCNSSVSIVSPSVTLSAKVSSSHSLIQQLSILFSELLDVANVTNLCCGIGYRSNLSSDVYAGVHVNSRRISLSVSFDIPCYQRLNSCANVRRKNLVRNRVRATAEHLGSASDPIKQNEATGYHPFEDITKLAPGSSGDTRLTAAETSRTVVEVSNKATILFSGVVSDEFHENVLWSELPYVTDKQGNIYFQVKQDEDVLQAFASETNIVQVIVGLDNVEMMNELDLSGSPDIDFGIDEIGEDDSDFEEGDDEDDDEEDDEDEDDGEDDYDEDWVSVLEDNDELDESDENIGDWAKLETMRYSHPMNFAKKLAEVASDDTIDWMKRPPLGVVVQGFLRPILREEQQLIQKQLSDGNSGADKNHSEVVIEDSNTNVHSGESDSSTESSSGVEELDTDKNPREGTSYYKLEMTAIHLLSIHGHPSNVEVEDFRRAQPDLIANFSAKIIDRLKADGEKTLEALKSLCWRCQGIQVEEAFITGVDALGFDVRVCSGTQLQTLRFAFETPATSEYSAEVQINDLLFPTKKKPIR